GPWTLAEDATGTGILAGARSEPRPLPDGRAVRIATGARIPPGANAVLRSEYGETDGSRLRTTRRPQPGTDIRPRGQECRSGDRLLPAGTPVTPAVLGLAAAAGYDRLTVTRRPRAEVLVLGDELLHRGVPHEGRIRDALGPAVAPWLSELGADVIVTRRLGDDAEALHEAVATTTADLLVTTGGTARGPVDHLRPTLARLGARLLIEGVRVRPGHPMLLARLPRRGEAGTEAGSTESGGTEGGGGPFLVGLPGNPLAALSGLATLADPLIRTLGDRPPRPELYARITDDVQGHPRDTRLVPVDHSPSPSRARPLHYNGPAMLRGIATATALAVVPPGGAPSGTEVQMLPLPWVAR
ncbi:molybdopterin molybdotransferase MoeA, partial [Streptomyces abyssalis]